MRRRRLLWQLYPSYILVIVLAVGVVTWYASRSLREFYFSQTTASLETQARLVQRQLAEGGELPDAAAIHALCQQWARVSRTRMSVINQQGIILGDSEVDPGNAERQVRAQEVAAALTGEVGTHTRFSTRTGHKMLFVAIPLRVQNQTMGAVRAAIPYTSIDAQLADVYRAIAVGGIIVILIAGGVTFMIARRLERPLEEMRQGAIRFASGRLKTPLRIPATEELGGLAIALNSMARELDARLRMVVEQRNEQEAVLASMVEGVVAVDADAKVLHMNEAAAELLDVHLAEVEGRPIEEIIRHPEFNRFVHDSLNASAPVETDMTLSRQSERIVQAHGSALKTVDGRAFGAVIVMNDVTPLRRLDKVRRDFVANVSHELKTPVTSIKGFVETLLGGALEDMDNAKQFLHIISRQADRLSAIIEDLLSLSRIEQDADRNEIPLHELPLGPILEDAVELCSARAHDKSVHIELECAPDLRVPVNAPLLEQAVVNLVDNAIKYSPDGGAVRVNAMSSNGTVQIHVRDSGSGIPAEHLPRLFERFYRVDAARSRELGGTGLGLAIVKHIAQAHHGRVTVTSRLGSGSTFTLHLNAAKAS